MTASFHKEGGLGPCENLKIPKSHQFEYQADYTNCSLQNADVWITAYTTSIKLDMYNKTELSSYLLGNAGHLVPSSKNISSIATIDGLR